MKSSPRIFVTGDWVVDHHIYMGDLEQPEESDGLPTSIRVDWGGCYQVVEILDRLSSGIALPIADRQRDAARHFFALWKPYPEGKAEADQTPSSSRDRKFWRLHERLGFDAPVQRPLDLTHLPKPPPREAKIEDLDRAEHAILVIDDGGAGFRKSDTSQWPSKWPQTRRKRFDWVVAKTGYPLAHGEFWEDMFEAFGDRLVVIVDSAEIRKADVGINWQTSWERTIHDIDLALEKHSPLRKLARGAKHLIINFGTCGALIIPRPSAVSNQPYDFIYDPAHLEGEWHEHCPGTILGLRTTLTAAIAWHLSRGVPLSGGVRAGLEAMRALWRFGHGQAKELHFAPGAHGSVPNIAPPPPSRGDIIESLKEAIEILAHDTVGKKRDKFAIVSLSPESWRDPQRDKRWSLLSVGAHSPGIAADEVMRIAMEVAQSGISGLADGPYFQLGDLTVVDRHEIESLRAIQRLVRGYRDKKAAKRPLCIGVFGEPGAGKSFGIQSISNAVTGEKAAMLTFNLAQFTKDADMIGAMHQVRDAVLRGSFPLVFWDEFDANEYEWLRFLLAPMQDGVFHEERQTHPIGQCIFVFASGTAETVEDFGPPKEAKEAWTKYKLRKGPDFISRLDGFINVCGPNQRLCAHKGRKIPDPGDCFHPIRRALVLRHLANVKPTEQLQIDPSLLHALLCVDRFKHGARSMRAIIEPLLSRDGRPKPLSRSNLATAEQLGLHVDADKFMALMVQTPPVTEARRRRRSTKKAAR
ncbi:MAG TPA: hypothetical protein VGO11_00480 [Chthoniobacteraceae bacterium]|jgi:hypothetical protein|nr:hypothetical protein [Chthoniobacteraceae bacterium]